jgi:hypothetical protein
MVEMPAGTHDLHVATTMGATSLSSKTASVVLDYKYQWYLQDIHCQYLMTNEH